MNTMEKISTESSISELITDLADEKYLTRQRARLLLVHHAPESIPALLDALDSQDSNTRWEAVRALRDIRDPETAPALTEMLMDEDTGVRWAAMESLIRMERDCLRPLLEKFIKDFGSIWMREGTHHILHVLKDRYLLNAEELRLFNALDRQSIPGIQSSWNSEQAWAAEKALENLDRESM